MAIAGVFDIEIEPTTNEPDYSDEEPIEIREDKVQVRWFSQLPLPAGTYRLSDSIYIAPLLFYNRGV